MHQNNKPVNCYDAEDFKSEINWLTKIKNNIEHFKPDDCLLYPESRESFGLFYRMCKLGFVTVDSQEGLMQFDTRPSHLALFGEIYGALDNGSPQTFNTSSPEFQRMVKRQYNEAGGAWEHGLVLSERAYVCFVTTGWMAHCIDYCMNRFTSFPSIIMPVLSDKKKACVCPKIGRTFKIPSRSVEVEGLEDLQQTGALHLLSGNANKMLENSFMRHSNLNEDKDLLSELTSVIVFDSVHGRRGKWERGLFHSLLFYMKEVSKHLPVSVKIRSICSKGPSILV
jgi:hypothetical protein